MLAYLGEGYVSSFPETYTTYYTQLPAVVRQNETLMYQIYALNKLRLIHAFNN